MTDFAGLIHALVDGGVECILIGGVAATVHGSARLTRDVDVVHSRRPDNLGRVVAALGPFQPYLRGAPRGLPFRWDDDTVARGLNFTLTTTIGDIDLFGEITGGGGFDPSPSVRRAGAPTALDKVLRLLDADRPDEREAGLEKLSGMMRRDGRVKARADVHIAVAGLVVRDAGIWARLDRSAG